MHTLRPWLRTGVCVSLALNGISAVAAVDLSGYIGISSRNFPNNGDSQNSLYIEPEWYWSSGAGNDAFTFQPFARLDSMDDERSHVDIRELYWLHVGENWELRSGINKVFWGVTESRHLVDVINQTDFVESVDGEDKLGQPMVQLTLIRDWGVFDAFLLPYFRERTFAGRDGRLQLQLPVDNDNAMYESDDEQKHLDVALRYSRVLGELDLGISYFDGTNRDPKFILDSTPSGELYLLPYYDQMRQLGVDLQATLGSWLWKLESIYREDSIDDFAAITAGFEYTFYGIGGSTADFGVLTEFSRDSRGKYASVFAQKDIFIGGRVTFNDVQSTDLLFGFSQDLDYSDSYSGVIEVSRRLGENYRFTLDAWLFHSDTPIDLSYVYRTEDFVQFALEYYF